MIIKVFFCSRFLYNIVKTKGPVFLSFQKTSPRTLRAGCACVIPCVCADSLWFTHSKRSCARPAPHGYTSRVPAPGVIPSGALALIQSAFPIGGNSFVSTPHDHHTLYLISLIIPPCGRHFSFLRSGKSPLFSATPIYSPYPNKSGPPNRGPNKRPLNEYREQKHINRVHCPSKRHAPRPEWMVHR